jgi:asparagine synthase (glutamine-hydrolysing)
MCGIGGVLTGTGAVDPGAVGRRMVELLRHRGPDAEGVLVLPGNGGALAHTRLKIVDLSERAAQPMVSRDGQIAIVFNSEIYDFSVLRRRLEAEGVEFRSTSDTEVILEQYISYGVLGLDALDGMFALAIHDARTGRLILMRDRAGKKPLYWTRLPDGTFLFGSEVKALTADPRFVPAIAPEHLPSYLAYGYVPTPHSLYRGLHKLPPGSRLVLDPGGEPKIESYWSLEERVGPALRDLAVDEATTMIRDAIGRAVERRLVADVPIGAFLSGGIDSSIVVAEMAKRGSKVRTFSVGFSDDKSYDELPQAREVARMFGTDHTELDVRASPVGLMDKLLFHHDEPYGDASALAVFAVAQATKPHVSVVLTGDGGDELFAGYTRFRGGLIAGKLPLPVVRAARVALSRMPFEPRGYKNPVSLLRRFVEHGERDQDEQLLAWNSYFAGPKLGRLLRKDAYLGFDPWSVFADQAAILARARSRGADRLDQILRHNYATYLLDDLLVKTDRMTMAVALEARCPFLDTGLTELAFKIPSRIKMRHGRLKWLLREAYRDTLPASILDRKKHGFGVPVSKWWSGELRGMVDDLLLSPSARMFSYLDRAEVEAVLREHRAGRFDHGLRIFALLQLELWLRSIGSVARREAA